MLVSLALASWTVHAMAYGDVTPSEHCHGASVDGTMGGAHDHGRQPANAACCCDFVACASAAVIAPAMALGSAEFAVVTYLPMDDSAVSIGAPRLDPDPPRPRALI